MCAFETEMSYCKDCVILVQHVTLHVPRGAEMARPQHVMHAMRVGSLMALACSVRHAKVYYSVESSDGRISGFPLSNEICLQSDCM